MRTRLYRTLGWSTACLLFTGLSLAQEGEAADVSADDEALSDEGFSFGDISDLGGQPGESAAAPVDLEAPPPASSGSIVGVLVDAKSGEPIIEAKVSIPGTGYVTHTDFGGRFRLDVPPGTYELRFFEGIHQPARTTGIVVGPGKSVSAHARLLPLEGFEQETSIVAKVEKDRLEGQLLARQRAAATGDIIGRAEIAKTSDSTAAEAARRVVGATVVGGRFVYVRGLGERYTNSLLDGAPLPSPEPDRAAVPLDLFPVDVLDNITIVKTFTPDLPGDFAGGSVQITTRRIPDERVASASLSGGYNTRATFRERYDHPGSKGDWLGFDSGLRQLPDGIPSEYALAVGVTKPDGERLTRAEVQQYARLMNSSMRWQTDAFTPPNHGLGLVLGNGWKLSGRRRLGAIASAGYSHSYERRRGTLAEYENDPNHPQGFTPLVAYRTQEGEESMRWGAFGSLDYSPGPAHELKLVGLHSQLANDETRVFSGRSYSELDRAVHGARLQYASRGLDVLKLSGTHEFAALNRASLGWSGQYSRATRDEPDTRDVGYTAWDTGDYRYRVTVDADSGRHFFSDLVENGVAGTLDWTQPLDAGRRTKLKAGGLVNLRHRDFSGRRFNFWPRPGQSLGCNTDGFSPDCPDQTFLPSAIDAGNLFFEERTVKADGYRSDLNVLAAYVMSDVELSPWLRMVVGERVEHTHQTIDPKALGTGSAPSARIDQVDLLPAASLILSPTERTKVRAGVSRTLARPQLRELAPFAFNDYYLGRTTAGNPALELTRITNVDLRLEHFPSLREVAAVSLFYKHFTDPIEPVLKPSGGSASFLVTYENTPGAYVAGIELEARKELGFLTEALQSFSTVANLTLAHSRIDIEQTGTNTITSLRRPLVNQAPWVVNLALDYEAEARGTRARLSYNVSGPSIEEVGAVTIPDAYRQPRHVIDLTAAQRLGAQFQLKAGVEDLLDSETLLTQGKRARAWNVRESYRSGSVVFVGLSYSH